MTNEERWKIEGRTREALRESKKNVAALRIAIEDDAKKLEDCGGSLRHFLSNPVGIGPTGMTGRQYLVQFFQQFVSLELEAKLREFESESEKVLKLEKEVNEFN